MTNTEYYKTLDSIKKSDTPEYKLDVLRIVLSDLSKNLRDTKYKCQCGLHFSATEKTTKTLERAIYYIDNGDLPSTK